MKTIKLNRTNKIFIALLALIFGITSCKKAADVNFNTSVAGTKSIHIDQTSGTPISFSETTVFELKNEDTKDYLDKIQGVTINSLTYTIQNFTGDASGIMTLDLMLNGTSLIHNEDVIVKNASDNATTFEVTDADMLNRVASEFISNKNVTIEYNGTALCDAANMDFDIKIEMDLSVTANPL